MSTGIGNHKYVEQEAGAYTVHKAICPYCGCRECEADHVDVGIGMQQCGPYYCPDCGASEASYLDNRALNPKEEATGWYMPHSPVSEYANTINGQLVSHTVAKSCGEGILDPKPSRKKETDLDVLLGARDE